MQFGAGARSATAAAGAHDLRPLAPPAGDGREDTRQLFGLVQAALYLAAASSRSVALGFCRSIAGRWSGWRTWSRSGPPADESRAIRTAGAGAGSAYRAGFVRCVCSVALLQLFCAAGVWSCPSCTYDNEFGAEACEMCDKPRPGASGMPWLVPFDAAAGRHDLGPDAGAGLVCSAPRSGTLLHAQSKLGLHAGQPAAHAGGGDGRLAFRVCTSS